MVECGEIYLQNLSSTLEKTKQTRIPFFSSTYGGQLADKTKLDEQYWRLNLQSPVRFDTAVRSLLQEMSQEDDGKSRIMLEIGPHSALAGPLRQIFRDTNRKLTYTSTLVRQRNAKASLLEAIGHLWVHSVPINLSALFPTGGKVLTDLPTYPWYHEQSFWEENRIAKQWRFRKDLPHEVLGSPVLEWNDMEPTWRNILSVEDIPWLSDHKIGKDVVFPAAGYIVMVGEALRQIEGDPSYSLRNVVVGNALVISARVEVMTVLRKAQLTTSQRSDWYDFSINSYNGSSWIRNCWGQVLPGRSTATPKPDLSPLNEELPTLVDSRRWYQTMSKVGLNYTGLFRSLEQVRSHPQSHVAHAMIHDRIEGRERRYSLHPSTMDNVFQLLTVASAHGQPRLFKTLAVPTFIEQIYVNDHGKGVEVLARVTVGPTSAGGMLGNGIGCVYSAEDGAAEVSFQVVGLKASPVDNGKIVDPDPHAAVQLEWKPVFDFVNTGELIRTTKQFTHEITELEKLFVLCAVDTLDKLADVREAVQPYLFKFQAWLHDFVTQIHSTEGGHIFHDASSFTRLTSCERESQIQYLYDNLLCTEMSSYAIAVNKNRLSAVDVFAGKAEPLDLLMEDNNLHKIYDFLCFWDYSGFLQLLGHNKPTLRVLEIGAGTGGTTGTILGGLQSRFGERLYSKYTYTDISPGFFSAAQQRFRDNEGIEYKVLDISKDPVAQGFEEGSYDLILAANVLHATPKLGETLVNVRRLLNPHSGRLLLQELNPVAKCVNFIFGMLPGWWLGADDDRFSEPYVSPDRWSRELQAAGFNGADAAVYDHEAPFHINATIVASVNTSWKGEASLTNGLNERHKVTFIHSGGDFSPLQQHYAEEFEERRFSVEWRTFAEPPPIAQSVVVTVDLEAPYLDTISEQNFDQLIAWIAALQPGQRVFWLTRCTQMGRGNDPRFATILGLARNIRSEMSIAFTTIEIDELEDVKARQVVAKLCDDMHGPRVGGPTTTEPDHEYVISKGVPYVGRFHWISVNDELRKSPDGPTTVATDVDTKADRGTTTRLRIGKPGLLQTLRFENMQLPPLKADEVLIKVRATGMNFKDLLIAMGIVDTPALGADAAAIGIETAGVVEAVGSAVTTVRPGDRVMAVSIHCFASRVVTREATCIVIPDELDFLKAATMPCVYATVIRALIDVGRMEKGQTVLIHSACGGVGIAAIQLCKMVGARVRISLTLRPSS